VHLELFLQPPLGFSHFVGAVSTTERRGNQDYKWQIQLGSAHLVCPRRSRTWSLHPLWPPFHTITESSQGLGRKESSRSNPLPRAGTPPTRSGYLKPLPAWPGALPGRGIHSCSGQPLPVSHHPHCKEHLPKI